MHKKEKFDAANKIAASLNQWFDFFDEFLLHLRALVDLYAGFLPVGAAVAIAGLLAYVFVDYVVHFVFVCRC